MTASPIRKELDLDLPRVRWSEHIRNLDWKQGEHTLALGPTGAGKSTLIRSLLKYREARQGHSLVIATKSANSFKQLTPRRAWFKTQVEQHPRGYYLARSWSKAQKADHPRVLLWVRYTGTESTRRQKREINAALSDVMAQGGWTTYIDELRWFGDRLKLGDWVTDLWTQGREIGISAVGSTQRPFWVGRDIYANSTHFYIWNTKDKDDISRLSGIGGMDSTLIKNQVSHLRGYDVLYINARDKDLYITRAPVPKGT